MRRLCPCERSSKSAGRKGTVQQFDTDRAAAGGLCYSRTEAPTSSVRPGRGASKISLY